MKILVIQFLRLGDMILSAPVVAALQKSRPDAQIDVLGFDAIAAIKPLLPGVQNWWLLPRTELQAGLKHASIPMLTSFSVLKEQLDRINCQNYDLIINLSATEFSGWVSGYLRAKERVGLAYDARGVPHFHSSWFRDLNEHTSPGDTEAFHFVDIFMNACGLSEPVWNLHTSPEARSEVDGLNLNDAPTVTLQVSTSDAKKNWSLQAWATMLSHLNQDVKGLQFVALGAPSELPTLETLKAECEKVGVKVQLAPLSLLGALALLQRSELLITSDTSIKHLANASRARVIELSLGSSDWRRTGIYKGDSLIFQGRVACAPCTHSQACSQTEHLCGLALDPKVVASGVAAFLESDWSELSELAKDHNRVQMLRTRQMGVGFWGAQDLAAQSSTQMIRDLVVKSARFLALNIHQPKELVQFGSQGMAVIHEVKSLFKDVDTGHLLERLEHMEQSERASAEDKRSELVQLRSQRGDQAGALREIATLRRQQIDLENACEQAEYRHKILRTIRSQWMEKL